MSQTSAPSFFSRRRAGRVPGQPPKSEADEELERLRGRPIVQDSAYADEWTHVYVAELADDGSAGRGGTLVARRVAGGKRRMVARFARGGVRGAAVTGAEDAVPRRDLRTARTGRRGGADHHDGRARRRGGMGRRDRRGGGGIRTPARHLQPAAVERDRRGTAVPARVSPRAADRRSRRERRFRAFLGESGLLVSASRRTGSALYHIPAVWGDELPGHRPP